MEIFMWNSIDHLEAGIYLFPTAKDWGTEIYFTAEIFHKICFEINKYKVGDLHGID